MRKVVLLMVVFCLVGGSVGLVFGQTEDNGDENWKKRIASPSYGLNVGFFTLEYHDAGGKEKTKTLPVPGIDLRHFNGINVPRNGRFYYGYELGLNINFYPGAYGFEDYGVDCTIEDIRVFSILFMVKHGYRFTLGKGDNSPGLGLELGMGILAGGADLTVTEDDDADETNLASLEEDQVIAPVAELGLEGTLHRGEDFSFVARLSLMAGMPLLDSNYGEMSPVRISLRGGFIRNH